MRKVWINENFSTHSEYHNETSQFLKVKGDVLIKNMKEALRIGNNISAININ